MIDIVWFNALFSNHHTSFELRALPERSGVNKFRDGFYFDYCFHGWKPRSVSELRALPERSGVNKFRDGFYFDYCFHGWKPRSVSELRALPERSGVNKFPGRKFIVNIMAFIAR